MHGKEIWVLAEIRNGVPSRATGQLLNAARTLSDEKGLSALAVVVGGSLESAQQLTPLVDKVLWIDDPGLATYSSAAFLDALGQLTESRGKPVAILTGTSATGLELMPRLAARTGGGYLSACVALQWEGEELVARRPVYGGKVYEEVAIEVEPAVLTVRPGTFKAASPLDSPGSLEKVGVNLSDSSGMTVVAKESTSSSGQDVTEAARIVAGGRGIGDEAGFKLVEELAEVLDGSVGASRSVVDAGWRSHDEQIGKSGKTVSPELYIACGISGMIHHTLGMNTSKVVVAINTDPDAPIFKCADYGLVADATKAIPELITSLKGVLK
jgi:electron transfer flavoprotein alpha subunit